MTRFRGGIVSARSALLQLIDGEILKSLLMRYIKRYCREGRVCVRNIFTILSIYIELLFFIWQKCVNYQTTEIEIKTGNKYIFKYTTLK